MQGSWTAHRAAQAALAVAAMAVHAGEDPDAALRRGGFLHAAPELAALAQQRWWTALLTRLDVAEIDDPARLVAITRRAWGELADARAGERQLIDRFVEDAAVRRARATYVSLLGLAVGGPGVAAALVADLERLSAPGRSTASPPRVWLRRVAILAHCPIYGALAGRRPRSQSDPGPARVA